MTQQQSIAESSAELSEMGLQRMSLAGEGEGEGEQKKFVFKNRATRFVEWFGSSSFTVQSTLTVLGVLVCVWFILEVVSCNNEATLDVCYKASVIIPCVFLGCMLLSFIFQRCCLER